MEIYYVCNSAGKFIVSVSLQSTFLSLTYTSCRHFNFNSGEKSRKKFKQILFTAQPSHTQPMHQVKGSPQPKIQKTCEINPFLNFISHPSPHGTLSAHHPTHIICNFCVWVAEGKLCGWMRRTRMENQRNVMNSVVITFKGLSLFAHHKH